MSLNYTISMSNYRYWIKNLTLNSKVV